MTAQEVADLRGWVMSPQAGTGVHLADDDGGWEFAPYPVLADQARRIAALLVGAGVGTGGTVGVLMETSHIGLASVFAVLAAGATLTPIAPPQFESPQHYSDRLRGVLAVSGADVLVTVPAFAGFATRALASMSVRPGLVVLDGVPDVAPLSDLVEPGPFALLQMTSGSTGFPCGVQVSWANLAANLAVIHRMCDIRPGDRGASWLPLHHDMGLVGGVFLSIPGQYEMRLLRPDQFVRDPLRWLRAAACAQHTVSPSFGLDYVSRRLAPADLGDLDLSGLRSLVVGADRIDPAHLRAFTELTARHGFSPSAFVPSYGLAEMTLIATGQRPGERIRMTRVDRSALRPGQPVSVLDRSTDWPGERSADWLVCVGHPAPGHAVRIAEESGATAPEGTLGEIVLSGPSVAQGYRGEGGAATRFEGGELYTGDAGFLLDGGLFVLGRMGTSLKVNGRSVFAEDLDAAVAEAMGLRLGRAMAVAVNEAGVPGVAVFVEQSPGPAHDVAACLTALRAQIGAEAPVWLIGVGRGGLLRTSSGKPRRARMWRQWQAGELVGAGLLECSDPQNPVRGLGSVRALFERARPLAVVPDGATVHFEGSLAEGFGNSGSDVDILLLVPGEADRAVMPTVLFVDGRRLEIRAQSHEQVRTRLLQVRAAIDTGSLRGVTEDLLNRVQRFLHGVPLHVGPGYAGLLDVVSYREFTELSARWWRRRAEHCLRYGAALVLLAETDEATSWLREGLLQAMKAYLADRGEAYLEVKWLPEQIARLRRREPARAELLDEYRALDERPGTGREGVEQLLELAARLGARAVGLDPADVVLKRAAGVTTWAVGSSTHVVRGRSEVFVLSAGCAGSWRQVVFGQSVADTRAAPRHVALFARHGLIALSWRGVGVLRPAAAMCDPVRPLTPPPSGRRPVVTVDGAPADGDISRSPLGATAFAECAGGLMLANMVLENAREDFAGAVRDEQWPVASLCGRRMVAMAVRILASAWGVTPLPGDPVLLNALKHLVPEHRDLAETAHALAQLSIQDRDEARRVEVELEEFAARVREVTGGQGFPSSFQSREQWQQTLRRGYQWLRMGGYLGAYVELDEVRDLLASGGAQPGASAAGETPR